MFPGPWDHFGSFRQRYPISFNGSLVREMDHQNCPNKFNPDDRPDGQQSLWAYQKLIKIIKKQEKHAALLVK